MFEEGRFIAALFFFWGEVVGSGTRTELGFTIIRKDRVKLNIMEMYFPYISYDLNSAIWLN